MKKKKQWKCFCFLFALILFCFALPVFAAEDIGSDSPDGGGSKETIDTKGTIAEFKQELHIASMKSVMGASYNYKLDKYIYTPKEFEDYVKSELSEEIYWAWKKMDKLEGYQVASSHGMGNNPYIKKTSTQSEVIVYLHRATRNLKDDTTRLSWWYGGEADTVTSSQTAADFTNIDLIPAGTYQLTYNFVPHVSGSEGLAGSNLSYVKSLYSQLEKSVPDGMKIKYGDYPTLGLSEAKDAFELKKPKIFYKSGSTSKAETGLDYTITLPGLKRDASGKLILDENNMPIAEDKEFYLGTRGELENAIVNSKHAFYLGHIGIAFDEYRYHETASYDMMTAIPMNNVYNGGASYTQSWFKQNYKKLNHGALIRKKSDGSIDYSAGIATTSGVNRNFKSEGTQGLRNQMTLNNGTWFYNYYLRSRYVTIPVNLGSKVAPITAIEYYYDSGYDRQSSNITSGADKGYMGFYRSMGYGLGQEVQTGHAFPTDIRATEKKSQADAGRRPDFKPWQKGTGRLYIFPSEFSESAIKAIMTTNRNEDLQEVYDKAMLTFRYYMRMHPDILYNLDYILKNHRSEFEAMGLYSPKKFGANLSKDFILSSDSNTTSIQSIKVYDNCKWYQAVSTLPWIEQATAVVFYHTYSFMQAPSELTGTYAIATRNNGNNYEAITVPPIYQLSDLYILNNESRTGLAKNSDENTLLSKANSTVGLGEKESIEIYQYVENKTNLNQEMRDDPVPTEQQLVEPGKPFIIRTYLGYTSNGEKIRYNGNKDASGYLAKSYHTDIQVFLEAKYSIKEFNEKDTEIDVYNPENYQPLAFNIPMRSLTIGKSNHFAKAMQTKDLSRVTVEPHFAIYEAVVRLTNNGIEYYDEDGWHQALTVDPDPEVDYMRIDAEKRGGYTSPIKMPDSFNVKEVETIYFKTSVGPKNEYYSAPGTGKTGDPRALDGKVHFYANDNHVLANDHGAIFMPVSDDVNSWISFQDIKSSKGQPIIYKQSETKEEVYDHIKVFRALNKNNLEKTAYEELEVTDDLVSYVQEGDHLKFEYYVKRSDIPVLPKYVSPEEMGDTPISPDDQNNVRLSDVQVQLTDNFNHLVKPINQPDDPSMYRNTNARTYGKLVAFAEMNADGTMTGFIKYDENNPKHSEKRFEAGMILKYEHHYDVPTIEDLKNKNHPVYNTQGKFDTASYVQKVGITMRLIINDSLNSIKTDDWSKIILKPQPAKRNMVLDHIWIKDETGKIVCDIPAAGVHNWKTSEKSNLDTSKNYYVEFNTKFEYPEELIAESKRISINKDLKTIVDIYYNGVFNENVEGNSKYLATSNLKGNWKNGQIGEYRLSGNGNVNPSTYNPKTNGFNRMMIPLKYLPDYQTGVIHIKIPDQYRTSDNLLDGDWEEEFINIGNLECDDYAVTNIQLFDRNGKEYKETNEDGTYKLDPNIKTYNLKITAEKIAVGVNQTLERPKLILRTRGGTSTGYQEKILYGNKQLKNKGDKVVFETSVIVNDSVLDVIANLDVLDCNELNNLQNKLWATQINYTVQNFKLSLSEYTLSPRQSYAYENISFSAEIGLENFDKGQYVKDPYGFVDVEIKHFSPGGGSKSVYRSKFSLAPGQKMTINGNLGSIKLTHGNNVFKIAINGGDDGTYYKRVYKEYKSDLKPYADNLTSAPVEVYREKDPPEETECSSPHTSNSWGSITFSFSKTTGTKITYTYEETNCDDDGCTTETKEDYYCENSNTESWTTDKSFSESLTLTGYMRSQSTINRYKGSDGWVKIGSADAYVRAGQWYEFYIDAHYKTDRNDMPSPEPYTSDECNYLSRSPGVSSVRGPSYGYIKISGYGEIEEYNERPYSRSAWYDNHAKFSVPSRQDIFGQVSRRRYVPISGKNGIENIYFKLEEFDGHVYDSEHPDIPLCDYGNFQIVIKEPLPLRTQITDIQ